MKPNKPNQPFGSVCTSVFLKLSSLTSDFITKPVAFTQDSNTSDLGRVTYCRPTEDECDLKAPFSTATTLMCWRHYTFAYIAPLTLGPYLYNTECWARIHQLPFLSHWYNSTQVSWTIGECPNHYANGLVSLLSNFGA